MTKREKKSTTYAAPLSGVMIGMVVKELRLQDRALNDKTARRYFNGKRVGDRKRAEIVLALGNALTELHIFPSSSFLEQQGIPQGRVLGFALAWYAEQWDRLAGYMRSISASVDRRDLAATAYMRLVVIDLSLRVSAAMWLAESPTPGEEPPIWAEESSGAKYLRQLLARCGPSAPTRDQLAETLGVSYNTVDSWLDSGVRPSPANLSNIADVLGQKNRRTGNGNSRARPKSPFCPFSYLRSLVPALGPGNNDGPCRSPDTLHQQKPGRTQESQPAAP